MRLMLVRHGQSEANLKHRLQGQSQGILTPLGLTQAQRLAQALKVMPFDLILSSDLVRARDTARTIAETTGVPLEFSAPLREWNVGELDGQPQANLQLRLADTGFSIVDFKPAGGESLRQVNQRAAAFLAELVELYPDKTLLLCSHGDFIRMLLASLLRQTLEEALTIKLDNTSLTILEREGSGHWRLESLNNTDHLLPLTIKIRSVEP
jgi:broad specificity phosphatase PhoE